MSLKNDVKQDLKPKDLAFILAIAGRIDAQARLSELEQTKTPDKPLDPPLSQDRALAQSLHKSKHVYYAYSVLDSLSSSYSMFKYFFDVCLGGTPDQMHDVMMSPGGIIGITIESVFLVGFSFLACYYDDEEKDSFKKRLADAWPYFRDVMKGLKNAYKGWRSAVVALNLLGVANMSSLVMPIGLLLGLLGAANRYFMRSITEARKGMMENNVQLLIKLMELPSLTVEEAELYLKKNPILSQTLRDRQLGFLGAAIGGFIDGLYLYVGVLTLSVFSPPLLIALASLCLFYTMACIVTRLYEEYEFQTKLLITQTKCQLVVYSKQLQTSYAQLLVLEGKTNKTDGDLLEIKFLREEVCQLITQFEAQRKLLEQQSSRTLLSALLLGVKNGLYAYGALSSVLFFVSAFLVIGGVAFPPAVIAVAVCLGLVFMAGFIVHSLIANHHHNQKNNAVEDKHPYQELIEMKKHIEEHPDTAPLLAPDELNESLKDGLTVKSAPQYFFQEWFEVFRSLFSGLGKGQKFVDFAGNPLQEVGPDGHYQDTPVMYVLGALSALLFGFILAFRALARGLGRPPLGHSDDLASAVLEQPVNVTTIQRKANPEPIKTKGEGESILSTQQTDSPKKSAPLLSTFGFFKQKSFSQLPRASSESALNSLDEQQQHTIVGLS